MRYNFWKSTSVAGFVLILGVSLTFVSQSRAQGVSAEEYAIYSVVLRGFFKDDSVSSDPLILKNTKPLEPIWLNNGLRRSFRREFLRKNAKSVSFEMKFDLSSYSLIEETEFEELIVQGRADFEKTRSKNKSLPGTNVDIACASIWWRFYERYPDSAGLHRLSRVVFNSAKTIALVHMDRISGCGEVEFTYALRKTRGSWRIFDSAGSRSIAHSAAPILCPNRV